MQAPYGSPSDVPEQLLLLCLLTWLPFLIPVVCAVLVLCFEEPLVSVLGEPALCALMFLIGGVGVYLELQWLWNEDT